jgi:predicted nuclease of predicted toxin-antitoxin system
VKFLFDHDVASEVALVLRARGHDVVELRDVLAPDAPDPDVWAHAVADGRIVITCNRAHFTKLATATEKHPGVILLFRRRTHQTEAGRVLVLLKNAGEQGLANNINFA